MHRKSLAVLAVLLSTATLASAQTTTVQVSPVTGNPTASGTNLLNALAGITTASSTKPYVIKLDPGIYDVGTTILQMKPYVDIEGSGQQSTILRGPGNNDGGLTSIVKGAAPAELRNLQVLSQATGGQTTSIAVVLPGTATSLRDVTLISTGGTTTNWGLRNISASPTILNVGITVSGGIYAYGISNTGGSGSPAVIKRAVINVSGATNSYGIYNDGPAAVKEVRDVEISVSGGTNNYGFYASYSAAGLTVEIDNSNLFASSNNAYGVYLTGSYATLVLSHTTSTGLHSILAGGSSYGVWADFSNGTIDLDQSVLYGLTQSLHAPFVTGNVGASRLSGAVTLGTAHCAASYNGSYAPLGANCT